MAERCAATTNAGTGCSRDASTGSTVCVQHDLGRGKCVYKSRRTGEPCGNYPLRGQSQCRVHGGAHPAKRRKAARRLAREDAERRVADLIQQLGGELDPIEDPVRELAQLLARVKVIEQLLWSRLQAKSEDRGMLDAYGDSVDRLGRFLTKTVELGIMDRVAAVQQTQVQQLADAFTQTLREQRAWLSLLLTERGLDPSDAYRVTNDFDRVSREKFSGNLRALPTASGE